MTVHPALLRARFWSFAVVVALAAGACDMFSKKTIEVDDVAASAIAVSSTSQSLVVGSVVTGSQLPSVKVLSSSGDGMAGIDVSFLLTAEGGSVTGTTVTTSSSGIATLGSWTLGTTAGANVITAVVTGLEPIVFTITGTAGPATKLAFTTAPPASVVNRATLPSIVVRVKDTYGNDATTSTATIAAAIGGGTLTGTSSIAATAGVATFSSLVYSGATGSRTLTFSSAGLTPVSAAIAVNPATPSALTIVAGNAQTGLAAGNSVPIKPAVKVGDVDGNGIAGVTVTFAVTAGNGAAYGTTQTTDAGGVAQLSDWSLGEVTGINTLTATTTTPVATQTFTIVSVGGVATKLGFSTAPGASVANRSTIPTIVVRLKDVYGNDAGSGSATIVASVTGGGSLTGTLSVPTTSGAASFSNLSYQGTVGSRTLSFAANALSGVTAVVSVTPGPATKLQIVTAPQPNAASRVRFAQQPAIRIMDTDSNTVLQNGVAITASISAGGGTLNGVTTASTNASGVATFNNLSIAGTVGARTLSFAGTALLATTAPVTLGAGAPVSIAVNAGAGQSANVLAAVSTPPSVVVKDADGNGVPGVAVAFSVNSGGGVALGSPATTNASGIAALSSWTMGVETGLNVLSASVVEVSNTSIGFTGTTGGTVGTGGVQGGPVTFSATSTDRAGCTAFIAHAIGATSNQALDQSTDCLRNYTGPWAATDFFQVTVASQTSFQATMNWVSMSDNVRQVASFWSSSAFAYNGGLGPQSTNYVVAPGSWNIAATSFVPLSGSNAYTFSTSANPSTAGCHTAVVTAGVTISDALDSGCSYTPNGGGTANSKVYYVSPVGGGSLSVQMTSSAFVPKVEFYRVIGFTRTFITASAQSSSPASALVSGAFLYEVRVSHAAGGPTTGAYTVSFISP